MLKSTRDVTLVEVLEKVLSLVPLERRIGLGIEFSVSEKILRRNLESIYLLATQRLLHLSHYLEWSRTIGGSYKHKPERFSIHNSDYVVSVFYDINQMSSKEVDFLNDSFASWINNQVIRELNEFFGIYLLELHEVCTVLKYTKAPITPKNFVDIKQQCVTFEKAGMPDRLKILRRDFGFNITHNKEVLSLYKVRNVFSHHDGVIKKKFCNKEGFLEVSWPQNTCRLKKRGKNEWVSYHKAQKPFTSEMYEKIEMGWLSKPEVRRYKPQEQIKLSYKDLNELIFFYLYMFNQLQSRLVDIVKEHGLKVRPFKKYASFFNQVSFSSDEG